MIEFKNFSLRYPDAKSDALIDLTFKLPSSGLVVLTGESGSGKSSLLRVLMRLIPSLFPAELSGAIELDGQALETYSRSELCHVLSYVQQDARAQFFTTQVQDEIFFAPENLGIDQTQMLSDAYTLCEKLHLKDLLGQTIFTLSSGERQRLALAAALMTRPKLLILDEPSANLDLATIKLLKAELTRLKSEGYLVLVAEHRLFYLKELWDQLLILKEGRLVADLQAAEISEDSLALHYCSRALSADLHCPINARQTSEETFLKLEKYHFSDFLNEVSLELKSHCITALCGVNGSGKTTLARCLMGLDKRHKKSQKHPDLQRFRERCKPFFVMQDSDYQLFAPTIRDELNLTKAISDEAALELLNRLGLNFSLEDLERLPMALSGGQKQRLVIALAMLSAASVLILDEPTSGLDAKNMQRVADHLRQLADEGHAILLITHDVELLNLVADEISIIAGGRILSALPYSQENQERIKSRILP
ncbi:MAG: ATP-binding cassette domain-containing protein [Eubacteriales bacterium]|nr:ATP-binding cassette domain-containing protein [Eubacteriales bacterium]